MTIKVWLDSAAQDAERRGLAALRPLLESLAQATSALRTADWNADATGASHGDDADREGPRRTSGSKQLLERDVR
jgi:hypothetical protein